MIVTEEEAKTKRCQESYGDRYLTANGAVMMAVPLLMHGPATPLQASPSNCIGSACMAWRWNLVGHGENIDRSQSDDRSKGYCGKAGRP